jgi:hypothetical protein
MELKLAYKFWFLLGRSCKAIEEAMGAALILALVAVLGGAVIYLGTLLFCAVMAFPLIAVLIILLAK